MSGAYGSVALLDHERLGYGIPKFRNGWLLQSMKEDPEPFALEVVSVILIPTDLERPYEPC